MKRSNRLLGSRILRCLCDPGITENRNFAQGLDNADMVITHCVSVRYCVKVSAR
jgi:hypothetical protein